MKRVVAFIHHFFIPSESNNFRARALHHDFLSFYLIIAFVFVFSVKHLNASATDVLGFATDITTTKLYLLTNQERQKNSLSTLSYNEKLEVAARQKAQDMFAKNYWAHYAPDGRTPWNFMYDAGYSYEYAGENLARNFLFSQNVVDAWMNSPSHRENVLRPEYTEVGFAIVNGVLNGEETTLVVQMFGKPLDNGLVAENKIPNPPNAVVSNLAGVAGAKKTLNAPRFSFNFSLFFIGFLILVLVSDFYFGLRMGIVRWHGKNIPHIIFLLFIFFGFLLFFAKGGIL